MKTAALLTLFIFAFAVAINEPKTDNIAVEPLSGDCQARQSNNQAGGSCIDWRGIAVNGPSPYPCACLANDKKGGSFPGTGTTQKSNSNAEDFVDYTIGVNPPTSYNTLTGYAFTDNTNEIFVIAKAGIVFHVDVGSQAISTVYDFQDQVHNWGDYGGLSIETHTNFAQNPFVYVSYVNGSIYGPNTAVNTVSFVRVLRLVVNAGKMVSKSFIIGQTYLDSNVLCSSSHAGGAMAMGLDGSLFITLGEGSHFDTDVMDFGQPQQRYPYSSVCPNIWPGQEMGAMKSQSKDTLGGKLIRVDPATGNGICNSNQGFKTLNPYCTPNMDLRAPRARIYAMGLRNPFSMNLRPATVEEKQAGGPGVPYIGDVGLGSYEEINAATQPGLNFGWPCWEGPQPMAGYRDSVYNDLTNKNITRPTADDGSAINCQYVYNHVQTQHPTYYWSRYTHDMDGLYGEQYVLGAGFTGNCVSGVNFYSGTNYPASFQGQVFFSDYGTQWIKSITSQNDVKVDQYDFLPLAVPVVDLEVNPQNGDMCYMELLQGVIHCLSYQGGARPPTIAISSNVTAGLSPLTVQFSADNSKDRMTVLTNFTAWNFGDSTAVVVNPNPTHVYTKDGTYTVTCWINNGQYTVNSTLVVVVGKEVPTAIITSPAAGSVDSFNSWSTYDPTNNNAGITFSGNVVGGTAPYNYFWDIYMVHTNHYHPGSFSTNQQSVTTTLEGMGANSHIGERINFLAIMTVTDANGLTGTAYTRLMEQNWYSNTPVPSFKINAQHYVAGQYIEFDASTTYDVDLDTITFEWDFGDGHQVKFSTQTINRLISHAYSQPGTYTITLTAIDNWGKFASSQQTITIAAGYPQNPPTLEITPQGLQYAVPATFPTVTSSSSPAQTSSSTTRAATSQPAQSTTAASTNGPADVTLTTTAGAPDAATRSSASTMGASIVLAVLIAVVAL